MRHYGLTIASLLLATAAMAQEKSVINNAKTPCMPLKTVDFDDCQWTEGFWADKVRLCTDVMVPHLGSLMEDPEVIHAYDNFKVAAGLKNGEFRGWSFHDGDFYKYVEALAYAYALSGDESINEKMDEIISVIARAQAADGYLHTAKQIGHGVQGFHHESENRNAKFDPTPFISGPQHEFYNFGHLMTAACVHHRLTGKENFLQIAIKASDLIYEKFKTGSPELARVDWNPPHYMGLIEMYRTTGDQRYLQVAQSFVDMLGTARREKGDHRGMDHSQRRTPIRKETKAHGHAGHGNYLYCGLADLYAETGEESLRDALERIWQNVAREKMYLTGATGPNHFGVSDNKDYVSEAYGKDYELPNIRAYNETCANIGNAMWNWRMFLLSGECRFADIVELVYYNSALSGISLDGRHYYYTNPLRFVQGHPQSTKDEGERNEFMSVFCCPPNIVRTIARMQHYAYAISDEGIWVNLYGGNVLDTELTNGSEVRLTQQTDYPWNGAVKIEVDLPERKEFAIKLRIPAWAESATVKVNGQSVGRPVTPGSFYTITRQWQSGDLISLDLPMTPQLIKSHPFIEETRNHVAVKYGPLVYCLESIDLPEGVDINDVVIPQSIDLEPRYDKDSLGGVVVLEGMAKRTPREDWPAELYRRMEPLPLEATKVKLIPYYAWSNRGQTDMTVWMPLGYD